MDSQELNWWEQVLGQDAGWASETMGNTDWDVGSWSNIPIVSGTYTDSDGTLYQEDTQALLAGLGESGWTEEQMWENWNLMGTGGNAYSDTVLGGGFEEFAFGSADPFLSHTPSDNESDNFNQGQWVSENIGAFTPFIESAQFSEWQSETSQDWSEWGTQQQLHELKSNHLRKGLLNNLEYLDGKSQRERDNLMLQSQTEKKLNTFSQQRAVNEALLQINKAYADEGLYGFPGQRSTPLTKAVAETESKIAAANQVRAYTSAKNKIAEGSLDRKYGVPQEANAWDTLDDGGYSALENWTGDTSQLGSEYMNLINPAVSTHKAMTDSLGGGYLKTQSDSVMNFANAYDSWLAEQYDIMTMIQQGA
tara:strand:+ start:10937 stop:12028 length:1092 start_codon:yes stop_codon:yes gene_type:complete